MADQATKDLLANLNKTESKSLLKKHLTKEIQEKCAGRKTGLGGTLGDNIMSGVKHPNSGVGLYACDPEAYKVYHELFDAVIRDYHKVPKSTKVVKHPSPNFGDIDNLDFGNIDPSGDFVVSTRVRVGRSFQGFSFPPCLKNEDRLKMEAKVKDVFAKMQSVAELKGNYCPLVGMDEDRRKQLVEDHFLFKDDDPMLRDAGGYNDWPQGRGIYFNEKKTFLTWVSEEDHLRLISMQKGGDIGEVFGRLVRAIKFIEKELPFAHDENYGYLTFCPTNLGTTLRASVHAKIPNVAALPEFKDICEALNIQPRGIHGEHTESVGGVYDLSNKRRLMLTEIDALSEMAKGVSVIILLEKALQGIKK